MSSSIVTGGDSPEPLLSRRVPLQDKGQGQLLQPVWATALHQLPEKHLSTHPTTTSCATAVGLKLHASNRIPGDHVFELRITLCRYFLKVLISLVSAKCSQEDLSGENIKQFWPMKKPRFSGSEEQTQARTWKPARNKVRELQVSNMTTLFNFLGTQASAKALKGNNPNQTWFPSPAGRVKKGHEMLDLFSHPGQEQDSPKHFSLCVKSCVKNRAGCVLKTHSQTDCSSDSIPSGLLCTQDSYIRVWRLRLLAVSWTLLHNTEPLSHCLQVLRASAWAGSSGWQGVSDLAQILDFITPGTLLECFKIKELPSLFPCLFQVKGQKHNQKTPPSAKAARPAKSLCVTFSIQVNKSSFQHLRQCSLVVTAAVEFRHLGQMCGIPALTQILAKYCRTTSLLIWEHSSTDLLFQANSIHNKHPSLRTGHGKSCENCLTSCNRENTPCTWMYFKVQRWPPIAMDVTLCSNRLKHTGVEKYYLLSEAWLFSHLVL